ncbi:hypothetical protein SAMN05444062_110169 [Pseudomonas syringae]|uniref:hypothetical protein n=1 Tax=Pseudomonas syringae TaxID=317 RepID=UPI0008F3AD8D|nr:hypothetical protein [Pseudomonas syringae]SFH68328.1 hypothetical protein SAMN05444062_110169 [Pseudomonas syringae]
MAEFQDLEYLKMLVADRLETNDYSGSVVICPRGHSLVIPGVRPADIITLKIAFKGQVQRFFIAMLHAYQELGLYSSPICYAESESGQKIGDDLDWRVLSVLAQIFRVVETSRAKDLDLIDFASLIGDERLSDVGELGIAFQTEVKRSSAPYLYYHNNVMGGGLWSSGQLRSAGIANSVGARWRFLLEDNQWQPLCGSDVLRKRLERIALLLSKCYLSAAFRKLNYASSFWPFLLAACAGWFYRMAINLRSLTNASSSTMCLARAFELSLQAQALYCKAAQFDEHGGIYFNAIKLEGCGKLVTLVESKSIKTKMSNDRTKNWVVEARTFLAVRNHSRLAHGVDDLDQTGYADLLKCSKGLICELLEPELYQEFSETYAELVLPPFHTQFKSGMGKLLSDYLD